MVRREKERKPMQKKENYFEKLSDEDFLHALEEFEDWIHNKEIKAGGVLEKAMDVYAEQNEAQGLIIMQFELLFVRLIL